MTVHSRSNTLRVGDVNLANYDKKELWDQLQSKHLPALRRKVHSLSKALIVRSKPHDKPVLRMRLVLKILSK
ncbi:hypothetical protein PSHT_05679 [Puccinia striiformis]|uniref:Uncharacterized protein n=1 Tax=Puccinia striiformis TaxID=27350 RepID=A0A2S4W9U4_9BASI|nr:hypothetical protein PSHT_05679 [Puccinia striiformis]